MSVYASSGSSGGSPYARSGTSASSVYAGGAGAAKPKAGGLLGLIGNFGSDLGAAAHGFVPGLENVVGSTAAELSDIAEHPIRFATNPNYNAKSWSALINGIGHQYAQTYGPLFHGHVNEFLHGLYAHPLGPILDLATVATGGAGAAAKAGAIASKAGVIADTSRLARLGDAADIRVPGYGAKLGATDGSSVPLVVRQTSRNPLVRARQLGVNKALTSLPSATPVFGNTARASRVLRSTTELNAEKLSASAIPFSNAYGSLNAERQAAFHLIANGVHPQALHDLLTTQKASGETVSDGMLKVLANPAVHKLYEEFTNDPKLSTALAQGEKLSQRLSDEKANRGLLDETTAAESPYRTLRFVNGAKYVEPTPGLAGIPARLLTDARAKVARGQATYDRIAAKVQQRAASLGTEQAMIGNKIVGPGDLHPSRAASAVDGKIAGPGRVVTAPGGERLEAVGAKLSGMKDDLQRLEAAHAAKVGPSGIIDQPGREIPALAKELAEQGRPQPFYLPMRAEINRSWRAPLRVTTNPATVPIHGTKTFKGVLLKKGLLSFHNTLTPEVGKTARYIRRADLHDALMEHAVRLAHSEALPVGWSFVKTKTGEHIGYTETIQHQFEHNLRQNEPFNFRDLFSTKDSKVPNIARDEQGGRLVVPDGAIKELQDEVRHTGLIGRFLVTKPLAAWKQLVLNLRPATFVNLTVGNHILAASQAPSIASFLVNYMRQLRAAGSDETAAALGGKVSLKTMHTVFPEQAHGSFGAAEGFSKAAGALNRYGVMRPTVAVENFLRRALTESWARDTPEIKAELRSNGGDINKAIQTVTAAKPEIRNEISRRVDAALGNYRRYSNLEQKVRGIVPFYGWDKHIVRSAGRIVGEFPHRADAIRAMGQYGQQTQDSTLGPFPSYAQGAIKLPGLPGFMGALNGRTPILETHSLNPFSTIPDIANLAAAVVHGHAGSQGAGDFGNTLNPFVQALIEQITGKNLTTGQPIKDPGIGIVGNVAANTFGSVPQATLLQQLLHHPAPSGTKLYQPDWQTTLAAILGAPVKKANLATAATQAAKGY